MRRQRGFERDQESGLMLPARRGLCDFTMGPTLLAGGQAAPMSYDATVLADTPAGYWRLDETSGTTAADSSGNARDGTYINAPTLSSAGATLNGTTQRIEIASTVFDAIGNASQDYTLEIAISGTSGSSPLAIFDKTNISGSADWNLLAQVSGNAHFQIYDGSTNPICIGGNINSGAEFYLAVVRDCTAAQVRLYVNGALAQQTAASATLDCDNTRNLTIGARQGGTDRFYAGKVFRAAAYLTALSGARIAAHYAAR